MDGTPGRCAFGVAVSEEHAFVVDRGPCRGGAGNEVASAAYLCRLEAQGHTEMKKLVLLK